VHDTLRHNGDVIRARQIWYSVRESLWFIPTMLTIAAVLLSFATIAVDRRLLDDLSANEWLFLFGVGSEGARATLSVIAQSLITVTGVVFSVTIVALQLAASQFTPRVLRSYMTDRGNRWVLGIFIATFTYTLLVERTVGSPPGNDEAFVPSISVTIAIALMLTSIAALIYFINHIAQSIRASSIINHVSREGRSLVDALYPDTLFAPSDAARDEDNASDPAGQPTVVRARESGYLQSVDDKALLALACKDDHVIKLETQIGRFLMPGEAIASVWTRDAGDTDPDQIERDVCKALAFSEEWTLQDDLRRALIELTDIGVRALSPSVNDPTTATLCIDRLGEVFAVLGNRRFPALVRYDSSGILRVIVPRMSWEEAVQITFGKIRLYGAGAPAVIMRLVEVCSRVSRVVPPERRGVLHAQIEDAIAAARQSLSFEGDLRLVEASAERARLDGD
jgi:uncharacterized membrane protein